MNRSLSVAKWFAIAAALLGVVAVYGTSVSAATIEGRLNGLECASYGVECPTDKLDPRIAVERDFVVQTADGKYYFVTNLDRTIKSRHALELVRIEGTLSPRFNAITAREFWVKRGGDYQLIWSDAMQAEQERLMRGTAPEKGMER